MFKLAADFKPAGDQPEAISRLVNGLGGGQQFQTLLGVTGSGKTFTLANTIAKFDRPVLVFSHNKTLAAQLYSEFKSFFPENAVEYFVSYYDYYLPEAYIPQTDTYIAKDASINENIERLRLSATSALIERRDVIVVASVSCIYGLGSPKDYESMSVIVQVGDCLKRDRLLHSLVDIQYERNDTAPDQGNFRVRGDTVDVYVPQRGEFVRIEFWGDEIESISRHDSLTGNRKAVIQKTVLFPCRHFVMPRERIELATAGIFRELDERVRYFETHDLLVEAQRLYQRTTYDLEMLKEIGYCSGIENYSRHLADRQEGSRPFCLLDFFPKDFITVIDESHVTLPQIRAMYKGDRSRKQTLVDHGFRLPSALDNRPLKFEEFMELIGDTVFVSATPGDFELEVSGAPVEQVVRPTGLLDPDIEVRPLRGQIDDVIHEVRKYAGNGQRILVTTLTKKSAERLADYLNDLGLKVKYLHSEIDAIQRVKIIRELRHGEFDCLIGINLLREGLDLPEVALVAILDADKEGFLRSGRALIQVAGRAARNVDGKVILYADNITDSMRMLMDTTRARRLKQEKHNRDHGIVPTTINSAIKESITDVLGITDAKVASGSESGSSGEYGKESDIDLLLTELEKEMLTAAANLEYERAADLRDQIRKISDGSWLSFEKDGKKGGR